MSLIEKINDKSAKIGVIGLGYVGLPLALEFSKFFEVVAYDNNKKRLNNLQNGFDEFFYYSNFESKKMSIF